MPLQKLQLRPGVNRESTAYANEGTWFEMDKVRFRSGYPEKIGGWQADLGTQVSGLLPPTGSFWGVCRSLWNWVTIRGNNLLALGTNLKFYLQNSADGTFYDVTPLRASRTVSSNAFTTVDGSMTVEVNDVGHDAADGDFVTISGVSSAVNGIPASSLNQEFRLTYVNPLKYTIEVDTAATASGTSGGGNFEYQLNLGSDTYVNATGWGAGGWGGVTGSSVPTGWGEASSEGVGVQMRLWSQDNFGDYLIMNARNGGLYLWVPSLSANTFNRAQLLSPDNTDEQDGVAYWTTDEDCPTKANRVATSDTSRFVLVFGCNDYGSEVLDPLLVRWSDQESYSVWTPSATNQAGSYRLSIGSSIVATLQSRQEILIWTDAAIYAMQYLGPPYVWGFQILSDNISIAGPNVAATAGNVTYWMGMDKFYMYGGRVETLYCPLRQYIFGDINTEQSFQFFASTNEGFNEIWFFYCSSQSQEIDRYVIYNHVEKLWAYGNLARTAWIDSASRGFPTSAGYDGKVIYHENGVDDATTNPPQPIVSYIQSADFDIGDGHNYGFVWRMIPDVTFDGSQANMPYVSVTLRPRQNPGSAYTPSTSKEVQSTQDYTTRHTYTVQQFTDIVYVRARGRQMAFRIGSDTLGVQWQLGAPRIDVKADGQR